MSEMSAQDSVEGVSGGEVRRTQVVVDISISLDGYVTGPNVDAEHGLGHGGETLHDWAIAEDRSPQDRAILDVAIDRTGAIIMGRTLFDFIDGPRGWTDTMGYGAERDQTSGQPPIFVLTSKEPEKVRLNRDITFVTSGGPAAAIEKARAVAGKKDVVVMGGGKACNSVLESGLTNVLSLHIAPVILGGGTPLFTLQKRIDFTHLNTVSTKYAQHITYRVSRKTVLAA